MKTLIVLVGPTGVGKTETSLNIAENYSIPIINADSRQIFSEIPIGTAAPTAEQQRRVKHFFVGNHSITDYYSASLYEEDVLQLLDTLFSQSDIAMMCGGSMMYIDAVCNGIDDMALIGKPIKGRIIATRPGHTINNKFARQMRREIRKHEIQAPIYDPNDAPVMDNVRIRELLPHRYPMQLVDKVIALGATSIVGVKNITANEPFFQGHFPQEPVMPGVLQIEAMAQCGGLLVLNNLEEPERWSTYFLKIDDVKFRQKVVPGDTLMFKVDLLAPVRHGISSMKGYVFVGDQVVSEATFTAQIVKNK